MGGWAGALLALVSCGGAGGAGGASSAQSPSGSCPPVGDAARVPHVVFQSQNRGAYDPVGAEGVALAETCRPEAGEPARDAAAFTEQLDAQLCGGEVVPSFSSWNVRFYEGMNSQLQVLGVAESRAAVHVLLHQSVGGMPGGAVDQQTFAVVLPPTAKPIVDCTSVTDHGPYSGPMPP